MKKCICPKVMLYVLGGKEVIKFDNKVTITCKGTLPAEITRPDRAVRFDYENTGISYQTDQYEVNDGLTNDWKQEITPGGRYILKVTIDIKPAK
ncbi:MAG: hypothetical protein L6282_10935 [Candidatus Methanoperedenaceae archaeon]|nr:hypothetical protein [Candidatus Methanoperedenaceae archaeon]